MMTTRSEQENENKSGNLFEQRGEFIRSG